MDEIKSWECFCCKEKQSNSDFLQVDVIDGDNILLSSYYEQRFVKYEGNPPPINASYCINCANLMPGLKNRFEEDKTDYFFEQNGYTCWNVEKQEVFTRNCGNCVGCNKELILKGIFSLEPNFFYILWSPYILSRSFPDAVLPQTWKLDSKSKFYIETKSPLFICDDCKKRESWVPCDGTIVCPLCENKYHRWIFHWAKCPVKEGSGCYCHVYKDVVMDGYVDPIQHRWIGPKPEKFDDNKPFCYKCLDKLVKDKLLKSEYSDSSSSSDELCKI